MQPAKHRDEYIENNNVNFIGLGPMSQASRRKAILTGLIGAVLIFALPWLFVWLMRPLAQWRLNGGAINWFYLLVANVGFAFGWFARLLKDKKEVDKRYGRH